MARRKRGGLAGTSAQHRQTAGWTAKAVREEEHRLSRHLRDGNCPGALAALVTLAYAKGQYHEERAWVGVKRVNEHGARAGRLSKFQGAFKRACAVAGRR